MYILYLCKKSTTFNPFLLAKEKITSLYKFIYSNIYLPYNSYVLLDKFQLESKGVEKTLVLNLNKTLVAYKYSILDGFEVLQRPGLIQFLKELSKYYEIVLFSNEDSSIVEQIADILDPKQNIFSGRLGRESTRIYKGNPIKDLNYLNRNLKNVIVIDYDINNVRLHIDNTVIIPEFKGDGKDRELLRLIVFLRDLAMTKVEDIKNEIRKWGNYKPYEKYYKSIKKYNKLLLNESSKNQD